MTSYVDFLDRTRERDLFASHDAAAGHDTDIDPHAAFAALRARGPVLSVDLHDVLGVAPEIMVTAQSGGDRGLDAPVFSALSFDAVHAVLRDAASFSQEIHRRAYESSFGRALNTLDAPDHRRMRAIVDRVFARRPMGEWCAEVVQPLARDRVREVLAGGGDIDLVDRLLFRYPAEVITRLIGLPEDSVEEFMRCAVAMGSFFDPGLSRDGAAAITDWILEILESRRAGTGDDLISLLVNARVDGERLSDEEMVTFVRLLFPAGFETTFRALANTLAGLLTTRQWDEVVADRSLVSAAIEEGLRWEPSVLGHPRWTVRGTEVCGVEIPADSVVHAYHASANRDETRWERPDEFDLHRARSAHSTFGFGPHICLGMHLGRFEMTAMLEALLDEAPALRIVPGTDPEEYRVRGLALRSPRALPVVVG